MTYENGRRRGGAADVAIYIASLTDELARLAESYDLDALAYVLDMAGLEAAQVSKQPAEPAD
jgi:hypothetical protein